MTRQFKTEQVPARIREITVDDNVLTRHVVLVTVSQRVLGLLKRTDGWRMHLGVIDEYEPDTDGNVLPCMAVTSRDKDSAKKRAIEIVTNLSTPPEQVTFRVRMEDGA